MKRERRRSDLENLTDTQKIALILLRAKNGERVKGATWLQKEMFLISRNLDPIENETAFGPDHLGPYSESLEEEVQQLAMDDMISACGRQLCLTSKGAEVAGLVADRARPEILEMVEDIKEFMNDLSEDEMLGFVYFSFPEMTKESVRIQDLAPRRQQIAMRLFDRGKVSMEKAADIAGLPLEEFIKKARRSP